MLIVLFFLKMASAQCELTLSLVAPVVAEMQVENFKDDILKVSARLPKDETIYKLIFEGRPAGYILPITRYQALQHLNATLVTTSLKQIRSQFTELIPLVRDPSQVFIIKNGIMPLFAIVHPDHFLPATIFTPSARVSAADFHKHFLELATRIKDHSLFLILQVQKRDVGLFILSENRDTPIGKVILSDLFIKKMPQYLIRLMHDKEAFLIHIEARHEVLLQPVVY